MVTKLQRRREELELSVNDLAYLTGISRSTISNIEHEYDRRTNIAVAQDLAIAFKCKVEDLFDSHQLTGAGRPPYTGTPRQQGHTVPTMICDCFLEVPENVGCDECGMLPRLQPA